METATEGKGTEITIEKLFIFEQIMCQCGYVMEVDIDTKSHIHYDIEETKDCRNFGKIFKLREVELEELKD